MAFEKVVTQAVLRGCVRKENAWKIISDYSRYSAIMDNVNKVEIVERSGGEGISRWYITVEDAPLYWAEKDHFNSRGFEIIFKSIEGDFDNINGRWRIGDAVDSGIVILFEIQYNLGIPVIEEVLGHILKEKMKFNIDKMMAAVEKELSGAARDNRMHPRYDIGQFHVCSYNGTPLRLSVLNLSAGGMMTRFVPRIDGCGAMKIVSTALDIGAVYAEEAADRCRFVFRQPLEDAQLKSLKANLAAGSGRLFKPSASAPQEALVFCEDDELPIRVIDITPTGMSFSCDGAPVPDMENFTIGNTPLRIREIVHNEACNQVNVSFSDALNSEQFKWMRERFQVTEEKQQP